ncbi:MAG: NosD domain-containing protein [Promethearchaeota archaeon]
MKASKNEVAGITLMDSNFISILNNETTFIDKYGVYLSQSYNNNLMRNNFSKNLEVGISLEYCNHNQIKRNVINYNYIGIKLFHSNYNYIGIEDLSGNVKDIEEIDCEGNVLEAEDAPYEIITILIVIPIIILVIIIALYPSKRKIKN